MRPQLPKPKGPTKLNLSRNKNVLYNSTNTTHNLLVIYCLTPIYVVSSPTMCVRVCVCVSVCSLVSVSASLCVCVCYTQRHLHTRFFFGTSKLENERLWDMFSCSKQLYMSLFLKVYYTWDSRNKLFSSLEHQKKQELIVCVSVSLLSSLL